MGQNAPNTNPGKGSIMAKEVDQNKAAADWAGILLDKADQLREEYSTLLNQRAANRQDLRNMAEQGFLSEEEILHMNEVYPPRKRGESDELDTVEGIE